MELKITSKRMAALVRKFAPICILLALIAGGNSNAFADCVFDPGFTTLPMRLSLPPSLIIQRDTPAGTVIWTSGKSTSSGPGTRIWCTGAYTEATLYSGAQSLVAGYSDVYQSNIPGIGFRVKNEGIYSLWYPVPTSKNYNVSSGKWKYSEYYNMYFKMELIYVGGDVNNPISFTSPVASLNTGPLIASNLYIDGSTSITKIACSLNSTSINVPLGDIAATKFNGIAATAGDKSFDLGLTCDKDAKINVSLAGTQNTDTSETSVLALTSAGQTGTASGVGVQLLYGGTPLKINNNILLKSSAGGQETLPFTARYYQTLADVGAGLANSSATLNITYQ
jgi:type 1 fimbria pilin